MTKHDVFPLTLIICIKTLDPLNVSLFDRKHNKKRGLLLGLFPCIKNVNMKPLGTVGDCKTRGVLLPFTHDIHRYKSSTGT